MDTKTIGNKLKYYRKQRCCFMKDKMSITTKRIRKLIDSSGKTRKELSIELGCDVSTIAKHYNGEREVNTEFIVKYADFFDVSADYLLGRKNEESEKEFVCRVSDYTGLSESAVDTLHTLNENRDNIFSGVSLEFTPIIDYLINDIGLKFNKDANGVITDT